MADTKEQLKKLAMYVMQDGLEHTFCTRSSWEEIEDDRLHCLRKAYIEATEQLTAYIHDCGTLNEAREGGICYTG